VPEYTGYIDEGFRIEAESEEEAKKKAIEQLEQRDVFVMERDN
jgi:hypothetical protein